MRTKAVERAPDRRALARDAGWGSVSLVSIVAGVLVAYAAGALLVLAAWAVAEAMHVDTAMSAGDWRQLGEAGGIGFGVVLLVSFFYGGYTSGRMARRSGLLNGLIAAIVGIVVAIGMGAAAGALGAWGPISREIHRLGIDTTWHQWRYPSFVAGVAALAGPIVGGLLGGPAGERWHTKLLARALDPAIGPEGRVREAAAVRESEADTLHRDAAARVATTTGRRDEVAATGEPTVVSSGEPTLVTGPASVSGVRDEEIRQEADRRL